MDNFHLSVAMCTYNGALFLQEQLDSIDSQNRPPDELIICDDGSTDTTLRIINAFRSRASFPVKIYRNGQRLGSTKNFEKSINLCEGDFVILSDQDDVWRRDKLRRIEEAFRNYPNAVGAFSDADLVDVNGNGLRETLWRSLDVTKKKREMLRRGGESGFGVLLRKNIIPGATFAFSKRAFDAVGTFPELWIHDAWIAINIIRQGAIVSISDPLVAYRQHQSNQIGVRKAPLSERRSMRDLQPMPDVIRKLETLKDFVAEEKVSGFYAFLIDEKIGHLNSRVSENLNLRTMCQEAYRGNYRKYSNGAKSFVKDCFRLVCNPLGIVRSSPKTDR